MTNLTKNMVHRTSTSRDVLAVVVKDATQLYAGALVGVAVGDGLLDNWNNVATSRFLGILLEDVLGATGATPAVTGKVDVSGKKLIGVAVAGTPTQAKLGLKVYCADGNVSGLTMTATVSPAIGYLSRFGSASDCDVTLLRPEDFIA